jgi:hypothetical protein
MVTVSIFFLEIKEKEKASIKIMKVKPRNKMNNHLE